jgi:uncharacterized membrane protein YhfC
MVSTATLSFIILSLVLIFGFPIGLALYLCLKKKATVLAVLVGALVFLVSQILLRIPLLQWLATTSWYQTMSANLALLAIFLSLTAGLFEETGRYLAFRFLLKKQLETKNALAYGVGHGGFEAIALVGMTYVNNLAISLMINSGTYDSAVATALGDDAAVVKAQMINLPPQTFALGGVERVLTILTHIGLSLLVYYAVRYAKPRFYLYALLAHTVMNFGAVMIARMPGGTWWSEAYVFVAAALAVALIFNTKKVEAHLAGSVAAVPAAPATPAE